MTAKLHRLQALLCHRDLAALVPPIVPLAADEAIVLMARFPAPADGDALRAAYALHLARSQPDLAQRVAAHCGQPPWIVRSAGLEDGADFVNAGGYASQVCEEASALAQIVANVAFSGFDRRAQAQLKLADPSLRPQAIDCFVQPLISAEAAPAPSGETPYLSAETCRELVAVIGRLHDVFGVAALDTEWALETDQGLVSATGLTVGGVQGVLGQLAFGFGFAAAQTPGERANALAFTWPGLMHPLWRGEMLRQVEVCGIWLLQVRPAPGFQPLRQLECLAGASRDELTARMRPVAVTPLMRPSSPRQGRFLAASTLDDAWSRYLQMNESSRADLAAVFVEAGEATEHAGIMFRQQGMAVFLVPLSRLPTASGVVVDPVCELAWFGGMTPALMLTTDTVKCLDLPSGLQWVFDDSAAAIAMLVPASFDLGRQAAPSRVVEALLGSAPGTLRDATRQALLQQSLWPVPDRWLRTASGVRSPSLVGCALAHGACDVQQLQSMHAESKDYLDLFAAARDPAARLPLLLSSCPSLRTAVSTTGLHVLARLLQAERWAGRLGAHWLAPLVPTACENTSSWLDGALSLLNATERLPIYEDTERQALLQVLADIAAEGRVTPTGLRQAQRQGELAPTALARLLRAPHVFDAYIGYLQRLTRFRGTGALADAGEEEALRHAAAVLAPALREAGLDTVWGLIRAELIDVYDQVLKTVLSEVVERRESAMHDRYLALLAGWIDFARTQATSANEAAAFSACLSWLADARNNPLPAHFLLGLEDDVAERLGDEFLRWQVVMPIAGSLAPADLPFANAHQLHNLLHQWLLAHCRAGTGSELPQRLRDLLAIADGFGDSRSALLRLGYSVLEISLPMVVHKASFLFGEQALTVEFAEIPNAPQDEIGRLIIFETLAKRIEKWHPAWTLTSQRVCVLGTWTLFFHARRADKACFDHDDLHRLHVWLRLLFDTAYDGSYIANEAVAHVPALFDTAPWPAIFQAYADYRETIDCSVRRPPISTLPFATTLVALTLDNAVRQAVCDGYLAGFDATWAALIEAQARLALPTAPDAGWASGYNTVAQLAVLLCAVWPVETLNRLAEGPPGPMTARSLAVSLFARRDISSMLHRQLEPLSLQHPLYQLALHHVPESVVDNASAVAIADHVIDWQCAFKCCKEFLLAHYAHLLPDRQCDHLVRQLDLVPYGAEPASEARIQQTLMRQGQPRGRFTLAEGDYIVQTCRLAYAGRDRGVLPPARGWGRDPQIDGTHLARSMPITAEYVRHMIIKIASDITGDGAKEILASGRLDILPRDAVEFMVRLQAIFDCTLYQLRYEPLSLPIDQIVNRVMLALSARSRNLREIPGS